MSGSIDLLGDLVAEARQGARGETGALELLERETEMRNLSKKAKTIIAGAAIVGLASTGVAYAYWTTTGSGAGSATNASANGLVTLHASWAADALFPGGHQDVTFKADNAGASDLYVGTIHLESVGVDSGHSTCAVGDFTMADVPSNTPVIHGADHQTIGGTGSLVFANDPLVSQNACKGATITLNLSSN